MDYSEVYEKLGLFYLGKEIDIKSGEQTDDLLLVKNKNLTTHAAIIGMTGSGKTGLGISMIEEAVLDKIPSIIIDPKGDMGNLLLAFDDFDPKKFEPWIDAGEAEKKGMSREEYAQATAQKWEHGILSANQNRARVKRYKNGADFTIFTPGSSAGIPISALSSFDAPSSQVLEDADTFSYLLNSTVTSILALIGIKADPLKSKEFLLLTTLFNYFWKKEINLTLEELIGHVANPPFEKIGVLALKSFYPQNERLKLAMLLNNVLASPTFSAWLDGDPLDIESLLYTKDAKPRVSILSIAHLNDNERMFFVTLFLNKFISWMRTQSGTSSLRAMLYMDEIYGFFPATSNPPSKNPMLLLLKQARAYGINITLSTQNPVDLDYKGLSNIGSWFIGRLQTKQDIERVIDGLVKSGTDAMDKNTISELLANLQKRVFLFKSAHRDRISLFSTRWVMSYLRGPLSKPQIELLMNDKKEALKKAKEKEPVITTKEKKPLGSTPPLLSDEIDQYYYMPKITEAPEFEPYLVANATIRYYNAKRAIDVEEAFYYKYFIDVRDKEIDWEAGDKNEDNFELYDVSSVENSTFAQIPRFISEAENFDALAKEFTNHLYHEKLLTLYKVASLKLESEVGEAIPQFKVRINNLLRMKQDEATEKLRVKFEKKKATLDKRYQRAIEKLEKEEADVSSRTTDTVLAFGMTILDAFLGRSTVKRSTASRAGSTIRNARKMYSEKDDVAVAERKVLEIEEDIETLAEELESEIEKISEDFEIENYEVEEFYIKPRRSDIYDVEMLLLWESRAV
jgi:hypothetical protein